MEATANAAGNCKRRQRGGENPLLGVKGGLEVTARTAESGKRGVEVTKTERSVGWWRNMRGGESRRVNGSLLAHTRGRTNKHWEITMMEKWRMRAGIEKGASAKVINE